MLIPRSKGKDENNTNDEGEERQKQDIGTWTVSPCAHCLLPKWTCVPYWDGPWTFQLLFFTWINERFPVKPEKK